VGVLFGAHAHGAEAAGIEPAKGYYAVVGLEVGIRHSGAKCDACAGKFVAIGDLRGLWYVTLERIMRSVWEKEAVAVSRWRTRK
jgi:hypothetical protein